MGEGRLGVACAFALVGLFEPVSQDACCSEEADTRVVTRSDLRCGPNALLMFLTLCEKPVPDAAISAIQCGPTGASLLQLRDAAHSAGLATEVRQYQISEVDSVPLPAIVQSQSGPTSYHYYVWCEITPDAVRALDGTTGEEFRIFRERLDNFWTGFALVPKRSPWTIAVTFFGHLTPLVFIANIVFAVAISRCGMAGKRFHSRALRFIAALSISLAGSSFALGADHRSEADASPSYSGYSNERWRDAEHGGANALYVLLRLYGYSGSYEEALSRLPEERLPSTLEEMLSFSTQLGYAVRARQLVPSDLNKVTLPIIIHLDGESTTRGAYVLLLRLFEKDVEFMNGPSATIGYMKYEDLLRKWSGVALIPAASKPNCIKEAVGGVVAGMSMALCVTLISRRFVNGTRS